jgi:uncharacterized membrane protein YccC
LPVGVLGLVFFMVSAFWSEKAAGTGLTIILVGIFVFGFLYEWGLFLLFLLMLVCGFGIALAGFKYRSPD